MQHMTTQILGLDKTKVMVETNAPAGMSGDQVKIISNVYKTGMYIYERKINIEPDLTLKIISVQDKIYAFYSSKTD